MLENVQKRKLLFVVDVIKISKCGKTNSIYDLYSYINIFQSISYVILYNRLHNVLASYASIRQNIPRAQDTRFIYRAVLEDR